VSKPTDALQAQTTEALADAGVADMRPAYRGLLRRLKEHDPAAFSEATARYDDVLVPAIIGGEDPIAAWIAYGVWIARRLMSGRLVQLDPTGLAVDVTGDAEVSPGRVLLYLPDAEKESAIPIACPVEPSPAQRSALQLLVR
jgi:hypothetical protein